MKALDTNVLVRYYVQDEPRQAATAARIMSEEAALFVPKTVILELEWVLRGYYQQPSADIHAAVSHLSGLPNVIIEQADVVEAAVRHYRRGIDFADALHLAASHACSELLTFDDRGYARRAAKLGLKPPVRIPAT